VPLKVPNESRLSGGRLPASHTTPALPQLHSPATQPLEPRAPARCRRWLGSNVRQSYADAAGVSWRSIHDVPNLSRSMANRFAKKVFSIFMKICPPSANRA